MNKPFDWITSDHHILHKNISKFTGRPYPHDEAGALEMSLDMIRRHNSVVSPEDEVWFLGDLAMGDFAEALELASTMNGRKLMVPGNHDKNHPYFWNRKFKTNPEGAEKKLNEHRQLYIDAGFELFPLDFRLKVNGVDCIFCHFPMTGIQPFDDKFETWRPNCKEDGWYIHGHVHEKWKVNGNQINVGVDVWGGYPVRWDAIVGLLEGSENTEIEVWT